MSTILIFIFFSSGLSVIDEHTHPHMCKGDNSNLTWILNQSSSINSINFWITRNWRIFKVGAIQNRIYFIRGQLKDIFNSFENKNVMKCQCLDSSIVKNGWNWNCTRLTYHFRRQKFDNSDENYRSKINKKWIIIIVIVIDQHSMCRYKIRFLIALNFSLYVEHTHSSDFVIVFCCCCCCFFFFFHSLFISSNWYVVYVYNTLKMKLILWCWVIMFHIFTLAQWIS